MAAYTWPVGLPTKPLMDGYGESAGVLILRSPTDAGPAKMRRRGARPDRLSVRYLLTADQVETLDTFVRGTLKGTARFDYVHPRTGSTVEVRLVPGQDGDLYSLAPASPTHYSVSLALEVLP